MVDHYKRPSCWFYYMDVSTGCWRNQQGGHRCGRNAQKQFTMFHCFGITLMVNHQNDRLDDDLRVDESSTLALDSVRVWPPFSISFYTVTVSLHWLVVVLRRRDEIWYSYFVIKVDHNWWSININTQQSVFIWLFYLEDWSWSTTTNVHLVDSTNWECYMEVGGINKVDTDVVNLYKNNP